MNQKISHQERLKQGRRAPEKPSTIYPKIRLPSKIAYSRTDSVIDPRSGDSVHQQESTYAITPKKAISLLLLI